MKYYNKYIQNIHIFYSNIILLLYILLYSWLLPYFIYKYSFTDMKYLRLLNLQRS